METRINEIRKAAAEPQEPLDPDLVVEVRRRLDNGVGDTQRQEVVRLLVKSITSWMFQLRATSRLLQLSSGPMILRFPLVGITRGKVPKLVGGTVVWNDNPSRVAREAARESGHAKFRSLGLTDEEIKAL